jgi:hypothetical protein
LKLAKLSLLRSSVSDKAKGFGYSLEQCVILLLSCHNNLQGFALSLLDFIQSVLFFAVLYKNFTLVRNFFSLLLLNLFLGQLFFRDESIMGCLLQLVVRNNGAIVFLVCVQI